MTRGRLDLSVQARGRTHVSGEPRAPRRFVARRTLAPLLLLLALIGCDDGAMDMTTAPVDPLAQFLPKLPDTGGAGGARAGRLTEQNFSRERIDGAAAQARIGDYFLANDKVRFVVQQPGRAMSPVPYGGNVIDADRVEQPAGDQLGELGLLLLSGRTANFTEAEVVRDGSAGGAAVLRLRGADVLNDYFSLHAIPALDGLLRPSLQAERQLGLKLAVTYILPPGASELEVIYTLYNAGKEEVQTSWGTLLDAGSDVESYTPGSGYRAGDPLALLTEEVPVAEYHAQSSGRATLGIFPEQQPGRGILSLPIVGFTISFYDLARKQDLFSDEALSLSIPPGQGVNKRLFLSVHRGGPDQVEAAVRARQKQPLVKVSGEITGTTLGEGVRVGVRRLDWAGHEGGQNAYTALVLTGAAGTTRFETALPPGRYELRAESSALRLGPVVPLVVAQGGPAGETPVRLSVPEAARLHFRILDESGQPMPGKISVIGAPLVSDTSIMPPTEHGLPGLAAVRHSLRGDSTLGSGATGRWDQPLQLLPGTYRVVLSHGPEWTRHEEKVTLAAGGEATVTARLYRVIDTAGYLACDFHQHTANSPDSPVLLEDRVVTNLAEGLEFLSSSDHDVITDFRPIIRSLGATGMMDAVPGDEITPFGYGHFIAWPLRVDPSLPNYGALDWGGSDGPNLPPALLFDALRGQGAQVVQINHPRSPEGGFMNFMQNFDRAALRFDFKGRTFFGDRDAMPVPAALLGLPEDASLFSDRFDSIEVYNGLDSSAPDRDGERHDATTERVLRDFMNFLSFGFTPAAVGASDTHSRLEPAGLPRTLVRVRDDSAAALRDGSVADEVVKTVGGKGGAPRDLIVSSGPMLQLSAGTGTNRAGIGGTARPDGDTLHLELEARTTEWAPIDTLEVFANSTFPSPEPSGKAPEMAPAVCLTSRMVPAERCRKARVFGALTIERVDRPGGGRFLRARASLDVKVADLLAGNAPGARGSDLWLLARTFGGVAMFPVLPGGLKKDVDVNKLLDGQPLTDQGAYPLAFTNPLFVDVDGSGWKAPFAP
jgi:hypothetical protein